MNRDKSLSRIIMRVLVYALPLAFLMSIITVYIPSLNKNIIDNGVFNKDISLVIKLCLLIFILKLSSAILKFINNFVVSQMGVKTVTLLKSDLTKKMLNFPLSFFDTITTGGLTERIKEVDGVTTLFSPTSLHIITSVLSAIGGVVVIYNINPLILLTYIPSFPLLAFISFKMAKTLQTNITKTNEMEVQNSGVINESIRGISEVKALNLSEEKHDRISEMSEKILKRSLWQNLFVTLGHEIMSIINIIISLCITIVCANLMIDSRITIGEYIAITQYTFIILAPSQLIASSYIMLQPGVVCLKRLREFDQVEVEDIETGFEIENLNSIDLKGVDFSYTEGIRVIEGVSLSLHKGESLAVVGDNGAGKTTLLKLMLGFYKNYSGSIEYNKLDLLDVSLSSLRSKIGIVFQESFLFRGTLRDNLMISRDVDESYISNILEICGLDELVDDPNALMLYPILEDGKNLSGGQKRKISIARTLLRTPDLLILDEPLANLDQNVQMSILGLINKLPKDIMLIYITHNSMFADLADKKISL